MEIPVYFSDEFSKYLHLFQFPNKSKDSSIQGELSQKMLAKSFKMDLKLDDQKHFSPDQAMHLSRGLEGNIDQISFVSRPLDLSCNFLIGRMKEDGMYLSLIDQISQFYPALDHLDKLDDLNKLNSTKIQDAMDTETTIEDAKIVQLSVRNDENSEMAAKIENQEFLRKLEEEKWTKVEWNQIEVEGVLNQVFSPIDQELLVKTEKNDYLDLVSPKFSDVQVLDKVRPGLSLNELAKLSLKDRITGILMNSHILSLEQLDDVLDRSVPIAELLKVLPSISVCIRGGWILNSELIYIGRVKDARNFLLYLFLQNEAVDRGKFNEVANLPLPMSKGLFSEIAILGKERKWSLKTMPDQDFIDGNQILIQSQEKKIKENGLAAIELLAARNVKVKRESAIPIISPTTKQSVSNLDKNLEDHIHQILSKHQVGSLNFILESLNEFKNKRGNQEMFKNLSKDSVSQTLDRLCFSLRGIYILKELGLPKYYGVRLKVVDCFRRKKTVSIGNVRTKIKGISIVEPTKDELVAILNTFATVDSDENWTIREVPLE